MFLPCGAREQDQKNLPDLTMNEASGQCGPKASQFQMRATTQNVVVDKMRSRGDTHGAYAVIVSTDDKE